MLRIFASIVLCLLLAMSPTAGQQFEQPQAVTPANVSTADVDKPVSAYHINEVVDTYQDFKNIISTTDKGNEKPRTEAVSRISANSDAVSGAAAEPSGKSSKLVVANAFQATGSQNKPASSKSLQNSTKKGDTIAANTSDAFAKQSNPEKADAAEALAEQSSKKDEKPIEAAEERNDPVPAGSSTVDTEKGASEQEASVTQNPVAVPQNPAVTADQKVIDTSMAGSGLIGIRYLNQTGKKLKLMVEKDGTRYTYNLKGDNSLETFPLQSGNGDYKVSILENTEGNRYRYILTEIVSVKVENANAAYLNSVQMINWNREMAAIKKAAELTSGVSLEEEKVKAIYNFIVSNIRYDYSKLNNLPSTYLPVIDETLKTKLGICYDFASLNAAMLRSVGIPAKLVMGYAEGVNGYHAWNEVYMGGKWVTIDTSYDSQMREAGSSYSMKKDSSKYQSVKEY